MPHNCRRAPISVVVAQDHHRKGSRGETGATRKGPYTLDCGVNFISTEVSVFDYAVDICRLRVHRSASTKQENLSHSHVNLDSHLIGWYRSSRPQASMPFHNKPFELRADIDGDTVTKHVACEPALTGALTPSRGRLRLDWTNACPGGCAPVVPDDLRRLPRLV